MTKVINPRSVAEEKHRKKNKTFFYKPVESKKQEWVAMVQNLIAKNTDKQLTNALNKMSQAEEIPIKWNKNKKSNFMNFMKYLMENQEDNVRDEKLWNLVSGLEFGRNLIKKKTKKTRITKNTTNENILKETEKVLAPVIVTKPMMVPKVKNTPTKPAGLPKSQKCLNYRTNEKTEWSAIIQNLIQTNRNEKFKTALTKISMADNIPVLKKLQYIQKSKFENLVKNIPGYEVNPVIDERLRIMITEALQEKLIQKDNEKYLAKKYPTIPIQNVKHSKWIILLKSLVGETVENICEELPSDAYQRIIQYGKIPKICYGIKNPEFKNFLKNNLECEVKPAIADQLMNLISKALEEQRTNKAKFPDKKNETNAIKSAKRKNDVENQKTAVNGTSKKRMKKEVQSKSFDGESRDPLNGTAVVCETSQQSIEVKWNTIGKTILRAQDANEMSLKKFKKKIVAQYLKQTGNVNAAESVEALWCKCQKKLSKNSKFIIDAKKIKLVTNRLIDN